MHQFLPAAVVAAALASITLSAARRPRDPIVRRACASRPRRPSLRRAAAAGPGA